MLGRGLNVSTEGGSVSHGAAGACFSLRLSNCISTPLCFCFFALGFRLFALLWENNVLVHSYWFWSQIARIDLEAQSVDCKRFDEERWNKSWRLREVINDSGICVVKWVGVGCGWDKGWLKSSQRIWEKVELRAHKGRFAFSTGTAPFFSARRIIYPLPFWGTSMASHSPYLNCTHRDKISH